MVSLIALVVLSASDAGFDRAEALSKYLSKPCSSVDSWSSTWKSLKERSPCELLHAPSTAPRSFQAAAALLRDGWSVPDEAASALLEAELLARTEIMHYGDRAMQAWIVGRFEAAIAAAPASPPVVHALAAGINDGATPELVERALATFPHPAGVALSLVEGSSGEVAALGAVAALSDDPGSLPRVLASSSILRFPIELKLQLFEQARANAEARGRLAPLARTLLADALHGGLDALTFELWAELPAAIQAQVLKPPAKAGSNDEQSEDLDSKLAAAAVGLGLEKDSRKLVPRPQAPTWPTTRELGRPAPCTTPALQELLLRSRDRRRAAKDPYPLTRALQTCYRGPLFPRAFAAVLGTRQPQAQERLRHRALWVLERERRWETSERVEAFMKPSTERIAAARKQVRAALEATVPRRPADAGEPDDLIARRLAEKVASPWTEKPLPAGLAPSAEKGQRQADEKLELPDGYWTIRVERAVEQVWVVAASQNLDPSGEVSPGGYWLLHSLDQGHTWERPLYTGLHALQPYVVSSSSALPLISGDKVQLEVRVQELDRASITFPPVGLGFVREAKGLFVEASLAELARDSDGDGLTDLVEARLLTDPHLADTDGDGIPDGQDPFPSVPRRNVAPGEQAALLSEVLDRIFGDRHPEANVVGTGDTDFEKAAGVRAPLGEDHVVFLTGAREDFVTATAPVRVVVLTEAQADRVSRERGLLYPMDLELVMDEVHQHAQINWSVGWRGGSFDATREKGRWVLVSTGEWIT